MSENKVKELMNMILDSLRNYENEDSSNIICNICIRFLSMQASYIKKHDGDYVPFLTDINQEILKSINKIEEFQKKQ
jgi:hypothetical protein